MAHEVEEGCVAPATRPVVAFVGRPPVESGTKECLGRCVRPAADVRPPIHLHTHNRHGHAIRTTTDGGTTNPNQYHPQCQQDRRHYASLLLLLLHCTHKLHQREGRDGACLEDKRNFKEKEHFQRLARRYNWTCTLTNIYIYIYR